VLFLKFGFRSKRLALFGMAWFIVVLALPVWYGVTNGSGEQYEHRVYTASPGAFLFLLQLKLPEAYRKTAQRFALLMIVFFVVKTSFRLPVYHDEFVYAKAGTEEAPSTSFFHDMLGFMYQQKNQCTDALSCYNRAIALDSGNAEYYNHRGSVYGELHDYKNAFADDSRSLLLDSSVGQTYINRSIAAFALRRYELAKHDLDKGQSLGAPASPSFVQMLDRALASPVIDSLTQEIKKQPYNPFLYNDRGLKWMEAGRYKNALDDFTKALELAPGEKTLEQNRDSAMYFLQKQN
ncbi:MAG TPA: tetratricopeptide repeat protein, partial [Bacteroidia bacterium]|nr:tetratricopeptide repeat protein [Bacteroidia bacterium]